ncbi:MAG: SPOR domain-containing protein [Candidatus Omnitrophica bacterium]|nr:SPOR domain-containing protein [Candidatus Omnitrophota bacterium]
MKKKHKRKNQISISEKDIQSKLYGKSKEPMPKEPAEVTKITEKDIMQKLYPAKISLDSEIVSNPEIKIEKEEQPADLFENKAPIQPGIQEEIDTLKLAITSLENKLKASLDQKERLKVKLVQKRKLINIREKTADLILNRMPEKFIMLLIVFLIFGIFVVIKSLKSPSVQTKTPKVQLTVEDEASKLEIEKPQVKIKEKSFTPELETIVKKRYTIQAAEYADEEAAKRFIAALKKQGYVVRVDTIYRDKGKTKAYFKINVGAYNTLNEAKKFNEIFKNKTNIKDSFIKELSL